MIINTTVTLATRVYNPTAVIGYLLIASVPLNPMTSTRFQRTLSNAYNLAWRHVARDTETTMCNFIIQLKLCS